METTVLWGRNIYDILFRAWWSASTSSGTTGGTALTPGTASGYRALWREVRDDVIHDSITVLQYSSITVLQYYSITVLQYYMTVDT